MFFLTADSLFILIPKKMINILVSNERMKVVAWIGNLGYNHFI